MRRTDRLFELVQLFRGGRLWRGEDLARNLEVSLRTIYRDIDTLIASGLPIEAERGVGYVVRQPIFLPPLTLTGAELEMLYFGMDLARRAGDESMATDIARLVTKIEAVLPTLTPSKHQSLSYAVYTPETPSPPMGLQHLHTAIKQKQIVKILYETLDGNKSERRMRALQIEFWGAIWTFTAWCELRQDFRVFRVDRVISCQFEPEHFIAEQGKTLSAYLASLPASKGAAATSVSRR